MALIAGDGVQDAAEACDDGNTVLDGVTEQNPDGNGCSTTCTQLGSCGDGRPQYYFEGCDDGNTMTETCAYGEQTCIVCVAPGYTDVNPAHDAEDGCEFREIMGPYCGDGVRQQH